MPPDARFAVVSLPTARTDLPKRALPVRAVIVHTTGTGVIEQALRKGRPPLDFAAAFYARPTVYASHYLVGYEGEVVSTVPEGSVRMSMELTPGTDEWVAAIASRAAGRQRGGIEPVPRRRPEQAAPVLVNAIAFASS